MKEAIDRYQIKADALDEEAKAAKAAKGGWSGPAERAQDGTYLEVGQDITHAQRVFLTGACEQVAKAPISKAHVRIEKGGPTAVITCKLASGGAVTLRFDDEGEPQRTKSR